MRAKSIVSGTNPLMGSAATQKGLRWGLDDCCSNDVSRRMESSSSSCTKSSSSSAGSAPEPNTSISPPSTVTMGVAPKLGVCAGRPAEPPAPPNPESDSADRPSLFFDGSPRLKECAAISSAASRSAVLSPLAPAPAVPSRLTPRIPCRMSPSMRASACARCAISPSRGPTPKCSANLSSLNDPTAFLSSRLRASGSVSTKRQSSGSSRPRRRYSACRNPASNCLALCAARSTEAPPLFFRASITNSSKSSAARANEGTAGADTIAFVIPVSATTGGGMLNRPGFTSVDMGACEGFVAFTAASSMIRFRSLLRPVVSRSNTTTTGISVDVFGVATRGLSVGSAISAADSVAFEEDAGAPGPAPEEPHADRPCAMRRCVALSARWRRSGVVA